MSEIQVGQINSTDGSTAITTGADGYVSFAKTQIGGRRNTIINGDFKIWQRGTTQNVSGAAQFVMLPDRFYFAQDNMGAWTISRSTDAPDGFGYSFKLDCTTADASPAASDYLYLQTRLEGQDLQKFKKGTSSAEYLTMSFWVKSNKTGTGTVNYRDVDNSRHRAGSYTINSANTWEHKTITVEGDTSGAWDNDNNASVRIEWWLDSGSTYNSGTIPSSWQAFDNADRGAGVTLALADNTANEFYITGVQLEVGTVATPFEHRSYGEELQSCLRYFWQITGASGNKDNFAIGMCHNTTQLFAQVHFPVAMRIEPTTVAEFDLQAVVAATGYNVSFNSVSDMHEYGGRVTFNADSGTWTAGNAGIVRVTDSASSFISFDAEL